MKTCPQCARSYPDSETFCEADGAKLNGEAVAGRATTLMAEDEPPASSTPESVECPVCGGKAQPGELICNFCGTRLADDQGSGAAAPSPSPRVTPENFVPASERSAPYSRQTSVDAPVTDSSGRGLFGTFGFIIAAVLALAAGGLLALYLSHKNAPPPLAEASPSASPSPAVATGPMVVLAKTIPIQVTGDLAATLPRDPKDLAKVFTDNSAGLGDAYRHALDTTPGLSDGMILRLHILPDGSVSDGSVRVSTAANPSLDAEVVKLASGWRFAPGKGVGSNVDYPAVFAAKDADVAGIEADLKTRVASLGPTEAPEYALSPEGAPSAPVAAESPAALPSIGETGKGTAESAVPPTTGRKHRRRTSGLAAVRPAEPLLRDRITTELAVNRKLRRVQAYVTGGNVTLLGKVFDDHDKRVAEQTVRGVRGVTSITNNLTTDTDEWARNANAINQQLQSAGLSGVTVKVIGKTAYLSGTVRTQNDKDRAVSVAQAAARVIVRENLIRVEPGGLF